MWFSALQGNIIDAWLSKSRLNWDYCAQYERSALIKCTEVQGWFSGWRWSVHGTPCKSAWRQTTEDQWERENERMREREGGMATIQNPFSLLRFIIHLNVNPLFHISHTQNNIPDQKQGTSSHLHIFLRLYSHKEQLIWHILVEYCAECQQKDEPAYADADDVTSRWFLNLCAWSWRSVLFNSSC